MIIVSTSGGVMDYRETYYARELARNGIAGLVVDSFGPRGVKTTVDDQSLVTSWDMENDAFGALLRLGRDARISPDRIGIMGISKGGDRCTQRCDGSATGMA
jgi:dienelactone hydrolase